jgi:hypothetical protein
MKTNSWMMIAGVLSITACGFEPGDDSTLEAGTPSKNVTAQQRLTTLELGLGGNEATDAAGATHQFETLKFHVKHIELDLPVGMSCDDITEQLVNARCEPILAGGTELEMEGAEDEVPHAEGEDEVPHTEGEDEVPHAEGEDEVPHAEGEDELPAEGEDEVPHAEGEDEVPHAEGEDEVPHVEDENEGVVLGKIVIDGPFLVDLNSGTPARLQNVLIPDVAYSRVDVRITPDKSNLLDGRNSFVMMTNTILDAQPMSVTLAFKFTEDMRFEAVGGVRVTGGPVLVDFDPSLWFAGMDFSQCMTASEVEVGQVLVDDDSDLCDDFEGILKENLKESGQLR